MAPFSNVLIPWDFSLIARPAALLGGALAHALGARVTLLHVMPHTAATRQLGEAYAVWSEEKEGESGVEGDAKLGELAEALPGDVDTALIWGHPLEGICAYAKDHDVDLIVLGAFGRSALEMATVGSIAERVARSASCSVLVARTTTGELPRQIVAGTDFSSASRHGIEVASALEEALGAELSLAHVHKGEKNEERLQEELDQVFPGRRDQTHLVVEQHPVKGLLRHAEATKADLLVVAAKGHSALALMLIGSVSERLARYATCSVLVTR